METRNPTSSMNSLMILFIVTRSFLAATFPAGAESASVLLQKGIYAEETEGNLEAAIE